MCVRHFGDGGLAEWQLLPGIFAWYRRGLAAAKADCGIAATAKGKSLHGALRFFCKAEDDLWPSHSWRTVAPTAPDAAEQPGQGSCCSSDCTSAAPNPNTNAATHATAAKVPAGRTC